MTRNRWSWFAMDAVLAAGLLACSSADGRSASNGSPTASVAQPGASGAMHAAGVSGAVPGVAGATASGAAGTTTGKPPVPVATGGSFAPGGTAGMPGTGGTGNPPMAGTGGPVTMASTGGVPSAPPTPHDGKTCLQPGNGNYTEPGPYKVSTKEVDLGMIESGQGTGKFTIYYPDPLETNCKHPIVAWGNGTGVMGTGVYTFLNNNAASWGMVVAESEESNTGSGNFHKAGLDYLLKENDDPSSMFYQKLSTRAGVSGHSQGGFGASAAASHPNVETVAIEGAADVANDKFSVLILTGTMDIVMNPEGYVTGATGPMFVANWEGGDHFTTETLAGYITQDKGSLQFLRLYAAWFRCFLADDTVACAMFSGGTPNGCGICKDPGWHSLTSSHL